MVGDTSGDSCSLIVLRPESYRCSKCGSSCLGDRSTRYALLRRNVRSLSRFSLVVDGLKEAAVGEDRFEPTRVVGPTDDSVVESRGVKSIARPLGDSGLERTRGMDSFRSWGVILFSLAEDNLSRIRVQIGLSRRNVVKEMHATAIQIAAILLALWFAACFHFLVLSSV